MRSARSGNTPRFRRGDSHLTRSAAPAGTISVEEIDALQAQANRLHEQVKLLLPRLVEARGRYAITRSATDRTQFESIREEASMLKAKLGSIIDAMIEATGLPPELLQTIDELDAKPDLNSLPRRNLTEDRIASTADLDSLLPKALDAVRRLLPPGWVEEQPAELCRLDSLAKPDSILSLTTGLRPEISHQGSATGE